MLLQIAFVQKLRLSCYFKLLSTAKYDSDKVNQFAVHSQRISSSHDRDGASVFSSTICSEK